MGRRRRLLLGCVVLLSRREACFQSRGSRDPPSRRPSIPAHGLATVLSWGYAEWPTVPSWSSTASTRVPADRAQHAMDLGLIRRTRWCGSRRMRSYSRTHSAFVDGAGALARLALAQ